MPTNKKRDRWESDDDDNDSINDKKINHTPKNNKNNDDNDDLPSSNQENIKLNDAITSNIIHHNPLLNGCRSVYNSYERLSKIDEGTYGIVWKAQDLITKVR